MPFQYINSKYSIQDSVSVIAENNWPYKQFGSNILQPVTPTASGEECPQERQPP